MSPWEVSAVLPAGVAAGTINAVVGSGTRIGAAVAARRDRSGRDHHPAGPVAILRLVIR